MALSSPGIGSNLDVNSIVKQLMAVESQPLTTLARKEASFQAKLSAFGSLSSALSTFQSSLGNLTNTSRFQSYTATSSDVTIATATASSTAAAGTYSLDVTSLAQAQTIATAGAASTTATIGAGTTTTLTFQFGTIGGGTTATNGIYPAGTTFTQDADQATGTVTIDNTNNSLQGIRDAINKAGIGVSATIISDGSATPNRLVLTSSKTGEKSSMKISVAGDAALQNLLAYNPADAAGQKLTETSKAKDTVVDVNGIQVTSATRTVSEAIQGITLMVAKEGSTSLTVTRDSASVMTSINGFVKAYNDAHKTLSDLTAYNPTTKVGGPLLGDATVRSIQNEIRQAFNTPIPELSNNTIKSLSDIGITFQKDGTLATNTQKLQNALSNNLDDVTALFASYGTTSDSLISYSGSTSSTKAGKYDINLTAVATQGSQTGSLDLTLAPTVITAGTAMNVSVNGTTASVNLTAGTYSASELAAMLQSAINGTSAISSAGVAIKATIDSNGHLVLTSNTYGSNSKVNLSSGTGTSASAILGNSSASVVGVDVAGSIGGIEATGSGQYLTGASGSQAAGLKLLVSGGAATERGTINFSRGYADKLSTLIGTYLGSSGRISGRTKGINNSIQDINRSRTAVETRLVTIEKRYRAQFNALDKAISSMTQTSTFLQQQLSNLPKISSE